MTATATESPSKRTEANLRNAKKSSGPRTQAGKDRSRFNALKHGMRANSPSCPARTPTPSRLDSPPGRPSASPPTTSTAISSNAPSTSPGSSTAPTAPGRPGSKRDLLDAGVEQAAAIADEVLVLGRRLFHDPRGPACFYPQAEPTSSYPSRVSDSGDVDDPDEPARVVNKLEGTAPGCAWLLDRWDDLRELVMDGQTWRARTGCGRSGCWGSSRWG